MIFNDQNKLKIKQNELAARGTKVFRPQLAILRERNCNETKHRETWIPSND